MRTEADKKLTRHKGTLGEFERAGAKRVERGNKVSAIDRRDKWGGFQRLERFRFVPVEKMAAVLLQPRDRGESGFGEGDKFRRGDEAKFACSLARIQQQADVGGRHAGSLEQSLFLNVVGDEVVVALRAELVKV